MPGIVLCMGLLLAACSRGPAQTRIHHAITRAADAARNHDAGALRDILSTAFQGNAGELDRRELLNLLRLQALRGESVSVLLGPIDIEPHGRRWVARFRVTLSAGGGILPDHVGIYRVTTAWRLEDGDWHCYAATWRHDL